MADQRDIDAQIQAYYGEIFDEHARLTSRSPQGPVEFQRTQEIIRSHVSGGRVLDIGGGAGVHARALQDAGYEVDLIDPVARHVEQAVAAGVSAQVADARELPFPDASFNAALVLGPLYHLASVEDRLRALTEARRVVRPGGFVFAAGLSRYIAFGKTTLGSPIPEPYPGGVGRPRGRGSARQRHAIPRWALPHRGGAGARSHHRRTVSAGRRGRRRSGWRTAGIGGFCGGGAQRSSRCSVSCPRRRSTTRRCSTP